MKTNNLTFRATKVAGNKEITVKIRLNDECKNGHQDFAITADIYQAGKPKTDRYLIGGGCCHEEILKYFPEFKIFVDLHGCDYKGIPMHATANMHYRMNSDKMTAERFCEYYRITADQYNMLQGADSKTHFAILLAQSPIISQWENQANEAIKLLEQLTGNEFLIDSQRTQLIMPTTEEINTELQRIKDGYYSAEAINQREEQRKIEEIKKISDDFDSKVKDVLTEKRTMLEVLKKGGTKALNNCIYYNHTKQLKFNWRGYDNLPQEQVNNIIANLELPEEVTIHP